MSTQSVSGTCSTGGAPSVIANIGTKGNVFAGTFIGQCSVYGWRFITGVYTDNGGRLHVAAITGDTNVNPQRTSDQSWTLNFTNYLGTLTYDPETGNLSFGVPEGHWANGALMGTYLAL
jgi:hypothetical protein